MSQKEKPFYKVRDSRIHGTGLFARCAIKKGDYVIQYIGEKISSAEGDRRSIAQIERAQKEGGGMVYIFTLNDKYDIDGEVEGNDARLMNHSCDGNCEVEITDDEEIWVVALKNIAKGDELTFNYGFDLEDWESHKCLCGSKNCVGYIVGEDYWPELRKQIRKKDRKLQAQKKKRKKTKTKKTAKVSKKRRAGSRKKKKPA